MPSITTGNSMIEQKWLLAERTISLHFERHTELETLYGMEGMEKCKQDCLLHFSYLAEAVLSSSTQIFASFLEWAQVMLHSRNIPLQLLIDHLNCMDSACKELLPQTDYQNVTLYIKNGIQSLKSRISLPQSCLQENNPLLLYARLYLSLLLEGDRNKAQSLILDLVKNGQEIPAIYEHIFQATQYEVGLLWQTNKITVPHEHYCTAATQLIMSSLYTYIFDSAKKGATMLGCTVTGDLHELGIRMVSDLFEMDGWDTYYMGANMSDANIINALKEQKADILAISVTMPFYISKSESLIKKIRADEELGGLKIIVGGLPFSQVSGLWNRVGADGFGRNAKEAISVANQMISPTKTQIK